jgi:hypothetical protein
MPLFQTRAMRLSSDLRMEAMRCVRVHGNNELGDPGGAGFIGSCETSYVAQCVEAECLGGKPNDLTLRLRDIMQAECNKK